jgi:hypothetical protein
MAHDDQFTATGPAFTGAGFPRAAFSTGREGTDSTYGVNVQGSQCGVYGESVKGGSGKRESDVEGVGVHGFGENFGVYGNDNRGIAGVYGSHNRGRVGVLGAAMQGATGVVGVSMSSIGNPLSTFGESIPDPADGSGTGVLGASGKGYGVLGKSHDNAGVVGQSTNSVGVWGSVTADREGGYGVLGESTDNAGVVGRSTNSVGVWGSVTADREGGYGVLGESTDGIGVVGRSDGGTGVFGSVNRDRPGGLAGRFVGPVLIEGDLTVTGVKGAVVPHADGSHRLLCAIESPESWFEDFGEAALKDGRAEVQLDPDFAAVIETKGYHVFLTPYGDSSGLYVVDRTAKGFMVREQKDGTSNLAFSYRVVARRKDIATQRLARVRLSAAPSPETFPKPSPSPETFPKPYSPQPK